MSTMKLLFSNIKHISQEDLDQEWELYRLEVPASFGIPRQDCPTRKKNFQIDYLRRVFGSNDKYRARKYCFNQSIVRYKEDSTRGKDFSNLTFDEMRQMVLNFSADCLLKREIEILNTYLLGYDERSVAEKFGLSESRISQILSLIKKILKEEILFNTN